MTRSAAVATGNVDTTRAAVEVLEAGGNAYDAAVAAGFAAAVTEPWLSSLGGGGFLLARPAEGPPVLFDFFVDAPGRGRPALELEPNFVAVRVRFPAAEQIFHVGWAAAAVPGCLDGYLHVHRRLGRVPLQEVVAPAARLAADGTSVDSTQQNFLDLLEPILTMTPEGREVFAPQGRLLRAGDVMCNGSLADFLRSIGAGDVSGFADPSLASEMESAMTSGGGRITTADLAAFEVVERKPLGARYRQADLLSNPPPSFGGALITDGLTTLDGFPRLDASADAYVRLAATLVAMSERHVIGPAAVRGTTHASVVDADGNVASLTTSNGTSGGVFVPGTGVQLNNMMGEADLHPGGFHSTPPGVRIGSMMAPTVVCTADHTLVGLGSAGSERIRSALTCVLIGLLDRGLSLTEAVAHPRMHWDRSTLQAEPGFPGDVVAELGDRWPLNVWPFADLYFGGVNAVARTRDGVTDAAADPRRAGAAAVVRVP